MKLLLKAAFSVLMLTAVGCGDEKKAAKAQKTAIADLAQNLATVSDKLDGLEKTTNERLEYDRGRLDAITEIVRKGYERLDGVTVQPPPAEINPSLVLPEETPEQNFEEVVPKRILPKKPAEPKGLRIPTGRENIPEATPMPNVTPKEPQPDSWVQVEKAQPNFPEWTHVAGSCGIAHPIIRWERDAQGNVVPVCCACRDQAGFPACDPIRYMKQ